MTKEQFLAALEKQLLRLPKADRDDILADYEAHFARGVEEGKSEEQVSAELGDPCELAKTYLENLPEGAKGAPVYNTSGGPETKYTDGKVESEQSSTTGIVVVVLLSVFVAVPVLSGICSVWFSILGVVIGCFVAMSGLLAAGIGAASASAIACVGLIVLSLALAALAGLAIIGLIAAVKGIIWLIKWYVSVCKKIIKEGV